MGATLSIVITAPHGLAACLPIDDFESLSCRASDEIILMDGGVDETHEAPAGVRHLRQPGASGFELRRLGLAAARGDWVVVSEDHCRLDRGMLDAYRSAIETSHGADLISGAIVGRSLPGAADRAAFIYASHEYLGSAPPRHACIANLAVRRAPIARDELARDGAFEFVALARFCNDGRQAHCSGAIVDHAEKTGLWHHCQVQFFNGVHAMCYSTSSKSLRWMARHGVRVAVARPWAALRVARAVGVSRVAAAACMSLLAASHLAGLALASVATRRKP